MLPGGIGYAERLCPAALFRTGVDIWRVQSIFGAFMIAVAVVAEEGSSNGGIKRYSSWQS